MLGVPENSQESHHFPPPMPKMRVPTKSKGAAPPAAPTEVLLGEDPDAALAHWMQQEEQMAEAVRRRKYPESLSTAQRLAIAEEECLGIDATTLAIMEDKLPITKRMKRKRRWMTIKCLRYIVKEIPLDED